MGSNPGLPCDSLSFGLDLVERSPPVSTESSMLWAQLCLLGDSHTANTLHVLNKGSSTLFYYASAIGAPKSIGHFRSLHFSFIPKAMLK